MDSVDISIRSCIPDKLGTVYHMPQIRFTPVDDNGNSLGVYIYILLRI